jgi:hypothetical protein
MNAQKALHEGGRNWYAHQEPMKTDFGAQVPSEVTFEGHNVTLWTYQQLAAQSHKTLKQRCVDLREALGAGRLPAFNPAMDIEQMTRWLLEVEVAVANACTGCQFTFMDFGVPSDYSVARPQFGNPATQKSRAYKGMQTPFAAEYSESDPEFLPNSRVAAPREPENIPPWGPRTSTNRVDYAHSGQVKKGGAFGGSGLLAAMMQAHSDTLSGADAARRRNQGSNIF